MTLKEFLAACPLEFGYSTSRVKEMRTSLRRRLFDEATMGSKYRNMLFDPAVDVLHPKPSEWLGEPRRSHSGRPCVRRLRQGEPAYRCSTCGLDDTCVLCQYCYRSEDHVGHDVFMRITHRDDGGICDCGDSEAWKIPLTCAAQNLESESGTVATELKQAIESTVADALDFVIDVMSSSHCGVQFMEKATDILRNVDESQLDPAVYGAAAAPVDQSTHPYMLLLWNDERRSFLDATIAIQLATQKSEEFGVMVARRVDAYGRGAIKVSPDLYKLLELKQTIQLFTSTVRSVRDYMLEEMVDEIIHWLLDLTWARLAEGPASTLRNIVGQAMCDPWRCGNLHLNNGGSMSMGVGMASTSLWHNSSLDGKRIPTLDDRTSKNLFFDATQPTQQDSPVMFDFDTVGMTFNALSDEPIWVDDVPQQQTSDVSPRFKYLIFFDLRFWKSLRQTLQDLYVSALISNQNLKLFFGREYADFYPQIAELYVLLDREPEYSCIQSLSTQLFTTPSIATELLNGPHFSQYIASLFTLLTLQKIGPLSCINQEMKLDADSTILKNRRFGQLFQEIAFLLSRNSCKQNVAGNTRTLLQVADFLSLCQGLSPVKRQQDKHIEFESEGWVYVFTTIPFVLQLGQGVATGAFECTFDAVRDPIASVARLLHKWSFKYMERAQGHEAGFIECESSFAGNTVSCTVSDYDPSEGFVSFHHPVHAFLSFLLQNCHLPDLPSLRALLFDPTVSPHPDKQFVASMLFEHSLQCISVLSQVRVGLWVRNGYTMRSQLHHYRENTLRELAYAQDLFMAQVALVALDTNVAFTQHLVRWNLKDWRTSQLFDESQRFYILEEFLHTLNTLLVDRIYLQDLKQEKINEQYYKREIVQALTFMDMTFSDLCRIVPESMSADDAFELVLKACANFHPPKTANDMGMYSLKEEYLAEFNPHYTHFSSARIEEAEHAIARKLAPKQGVSVENFVHVAPLQPLYGAWADLGAFTRCVAFAEFMHELYGSLVSNINTANKADVETVLNSASYLLIMAAQDDRQRDRAMSTTLPGVYDSLKDWMLAPHNGSSFYDIVQHVLQSNQLSSLHSRLIKLCEVLGLEPAAATSTAVAELIEPDERKTMAQAAKKRIMEEMRQQRQDFQQQQQPDDVEMNEEPEQVEDDGTGWSFARSNCVLCHLPESSDSIFGQMTFSCNVSIIRQHDDHWASQAFGQASSLDKEEPKQLHEAEGNEWWKQYWTETEDTSCGPSYPQDKIDKTTKIITGCGHGVHFSCYKDYLDLQAQRVNQQMRLTAEDTKLGQYLCPLCRAINDSFVPIIWRKNDLSAQDLLAGEHSFQLPEDLAAGGTPRLLTETILMPGAQEALGEPNSPLLAAVAEQQSKVGSSLFAVFADTIKTMEIALRGRSTACQFGGILVDQLAGKQVKNLRAMAHYLDVVAFTSSQDAPPPLTSDPVLNLVILVYLYCSRGTVSVATALRWCYLSAISQLLDCTIPAPDYGELKSDDVLALDILGSTPKNQFSLISRYITIFLRRASLIVYGLCGNYDEDDFKCMQHLPEHERLCDYLKLPTLEDALRLLAKSPLPSMEPALLEYAGIYKLTRLPPRLDCFYNTRGTNDDFPTDPAFCLFCGSVIPGKAPLVNPNEDGQCTLHMASCTQNYGIFIFPRRNHLFLAIKNDRGTFLEAPYLDVHGEPDESRRGRAHFLHPSRRDNIIWKLWLENEIFDVITRKLDQSHDYGGWRTI